MSEEERLQGFDALFLIALAFASVVILSAVEVPDVMQVILWLIIWTVAIYFLIITIITVVIFISVIRR